MKTTKQYKEMTNEEKAQFIMDNASSEELQHLILDLSDYYDACGVQPVDDWLTSFIEGNAEDIATLIEVAQWSKGLNINKKYVRESIYYYGYKTSDNVLDLVDEDEVVGWISTALDENDPIIDDLNSRFEIECYLKEEEKEEA